jgi:acetyl-CoA acetyltransferase
MRDVAIVSFARLSTPRSVEDEVEMLVPVITKAIRDSGIPKKEIGFTVSGSCDYLGGRPFSFVMALDAVGAWPPISESHVEMDGAWALYEAWVRLQHGDIDSALVYAFGRSSQGDLSDVLVAQLDPYVVAPLAPDWVSLAALQARALCDAGRCSERVAAEVAAPSSCDGASAAVLVAGDLARKVCARPAWIRGIDHRIEAHSLGVRDLTRSPSTQLAAKKAGATGRSFDVAEIHAPFAHQEIILREELGLGTNVKVNPSGDENPFIVAGLNRIGEAASRIIDGSAKSALAHATSGPCLQQNLVCVLEASP